MKKNYLTNQKAFSLVETLIAISILMLAILGPLAIVSSSIRNSTIARDQMTAYYLAQEGMDYIRYVRDTNAVYNLNNPASPHGWLDGLTYCAGTNGCKVDVPQAINDAKTNAYSPTSNMVPSPCNPTCDQLKVDSNGYYGYSGSKSSPFTRTITMTQVAHSTGFVPNGDEYVVKVKMDWSTNDIHKSFTLSENLFNVY